MTKTFTIGQLGKKADLPPKTIRYYEEIHLISNAKRGENGYRVYGEDAIEELQMIKHARDLGLSIVEIKKLIRGCSGKSCTHTKTYVSSEISQYLRQVQARIQELQTLHHGLTKLHHNLIHTNDFCKEGKYCCNILHQLLELKKGGSNAST